MATQMISQPPSKSNSYIDSDLLKELRTVRIVDTPINKDTDLVGHEYFDLKIVKYIKSLKGNRLWKCECKCGNFRSVTTGQLTSGHIRRCDACVKKISQRARTRFVIENQYFMKTLDKEGRETCEL